jgi:O-antigen/teichoic acid export membrane protein
MEVQASEDTLIRSDIKSRAVKSVKWTMLGEIASRSVRPVITLILARILAPEDFGIFGVAVIATGLAQILQDFGLGKTLIQRETEIDKSANIVFWTNLALSIFLYLLLFITAPLLSKFFREAKVTSVLRVLCIQIVFFSLFSVHKALLQRKFRFKQLFFISLFSATTIGLVSIPLALLDCGVWSLVFGALASAFIQVLLFMKMSDFRPRLGIDRKLAKQLLRFGSWVTSEAFLGWLIVWGDSIVLGHFLGVEELGIYRVGVTFLTFAFGIFFNPLTLVAYPAFSRLQSNIEELKQSFLKITKIIASISLPIGVGLATLGPSISSGVFGNKWEGIEIIIALIGIKEAISWLISINPEVYRAIGRPDINSKLRLFIVIYYIPVYVLAAPYGLLVFCIARLAVAVIPIFIHLFIVKKLFRLPYTYLFDCIKVPLVSALVMGAIVYGIRNLSANYILEPQLWLRVSVLVISGIFFYLLGLRLLNKDLIHNLIRLVKNAMT